MDASGCCCSQEHRSGCPSVWLSRTGYPHSFEPPALKILASDLGGSCRIPTQCPTLTHTERYSVLTGISQRLGSPNIQGFKEPAALHEHSPHSQLICVMHKWMHSSVSGKASASFFSWDADAVSKGAPLCSLENQY